MICFFIIGVLIDRGFWVEIKDDIENFGNFIV